jgi:hypothetical protein
MLLGGIVFYLPQLTWSAVVKRWLARLLFSVVILSGVLIGHSALWPTPIALIPVCAVAVILWLNQSLATFQLKPINWLGEVSYSLYLWHWPIAVVLIYQNTKPSVFNAIVALVLSLLLAWLSYRFVETPARGLQINKRSLIMSTGVFGGLGVLALSVFLTNGYPVQLRLPPEVAKADLEQLNREPRKSKCLTLSGTHSQRCIYGENPSIALILFGDSHASALVSAVRDAVKPYGSVLFIAKAGCPSLIEGDIRKPDGGECRDFVNKQLQAIEADYPQVPVMVVSRWPYYYLGSVKPVAQEPPTLPSDLTERFVDSFASTWCPVAQQRKVFALTPVPEFESSVPKAVAYSLWENRPLPTLAKERVVQRSGWVAEGLNASAQQCDIQVVDITQALCNDTTCDIWLDNRPLYYDDNHLSEWGGQYLVPYLEQSLTKDGQFR